MKFCVVLGGGGHAAVLIEALGACNMAIARAVLDPDAAKWGQEVMGVPVLGGDEVLPELVRRGADCFVIGLGTTGAGDLRRHLFEYGLSCGLAPLTVVHPTAWISASATIGLGSQLLPASVVHTRTVVGRNVIINTGAIVEHDCQVGDHSHVATGARLAGGVVVDTGAMVGLGACVRQGLRIGQNSIIGAGAAVVHDVPPGVVVAGVPAKLLRLVERVTPLK